MKKTQQYTILMEAESRVQMRFDRKMIFVGSTSDTKRKLFTRKKIPDPKIFGIQVTHKHTMKKERIFFVLQKDSAR